MRDWRLLLEGEAASRLFILGRLDEAQRLTERASSLAGFPRSAHPTRAREPRSRSTGVAPPRPSS